MSTFDPAGWVARLATFRQRAALMSDGRTLGFWCMDIDDAFGAPDEREAEWLDLWREIKAPENKAALRSYLAALR
jgi:hypothetical protein